MTSLELESLEFENHLVSDLMEGGAQPDEARRLAALAEAISRAELEIDSHYASSVETLLLRDRPGESLAKVISLRRRREARPPVQQTPALYAIPLAEFAPRRTRFAVRISVAAAIVLLASVGMARIMRMGAVESRPRAIPPEVLEPPSPDPFIQPGRLSPALPMPVYAPVTPRSHDAGSQTSVSDPNDGSKPSPRGCSIGGDKDQGAGVVPVPSVHCHGGADQGRGSSSASSSGEVLGVPLP